LTEEEIKEFIEQLKADTGGDPYFGVFKYGSTSDESYIKANKQGLKLFASQILEAVNQVDQTRSDETKNIIPLDYDWTDDNSDTIVQYIEPVVYSTDKKKVIEEPESLKDKAIKYGCFAGLIFLLVAAFTGIVTILKWLF
jgi:hypothetical protein